MPTKLWGQLRSGSHRIGLPRSPGDFYNGTSQQVGYRYTDAWFAVLYIADRHGEAKLRRFVVRARCPEDASTKEIRAAEAAALREVLGTDRARFLRDVRAYAMRVRGNFM